MILKGIWAASQHWSGGQPFQDAEDFAYGRFSWRVKDNLAPDARLDRALQLLASSIPLGMFVFRDLEAQLDDPAEHDAAEQLHRPPCFAGLRPTALHATSGCCLSAVPIVARGNNPAADHGRPGLARFLFAGRNRSFVVAFIRGLIWPSDMPLPAWPVCRPTAATRLHAPSHGPLYPHLYRRFDRPASLGMKSSIKISVQVAFQP